MSNDKDKKFSGKKEDALSVTEEFENGDAVEIFEQDTVVTLFDDEDKPIEFYEIASIEHDQKFYELLQPVEPIEDLGEDEAVIFEYIVEEGSNDKIFKPIFDEELLEEVFSIYLRAVADYQFEEGCDCGCEDCDGECDGDKDCDCDDENCDCKKDKK